MDCATSLEQLIDRCLEIGINCLAIADHGTIEGALELQKKSPFTVIIAEEILTPHGEIMGMFLRQGIESNQSVEETLNQIETQDGLVCIPHPYDRFRASALDNKTLKAIMPSIDIIEVFNARSLTPGSGARARGVMRKFGKLASAGSDAHSPQEIGNAYVEMPEFIGKSEFLVSLSQGRIVGHSSSPLVHLTSTRNKLRKPLLDKE